MVGRIGSVEGVICFDQDEAAGETSFQDNLKRGRASPRSEVGGDARPDPKDTAHLIYTSGTTGNPKGVKLSHENITTNVVACLEIFGGSALSSADRSLSILPWAHSFGLTLELHQTIATGSSFGVVRDARDRCDTVMARLDGVTLSHCTAIAKPRDKDGAHVDSVLHHLDHSINFSNVVNTK